MPSTVFIEACKHNHLLYFLEIKCPAFIAVNVAQNNTPGSYGQTLHIQCPVGHQTTAGLTEYSATCGATKAWSQMHSCWREYCFSIKTLEKIVTTQNNIDYVYIQTDICKVILLE